ncbi:hypothetical protein OQA88_13405 [Cercophora sp. LCS_1]
MLASIILLAGIAALATSSPITSRDWQPGNYPPYTTSSGIVLIANLSNPFNTIFDPPVQHWSLGSVHVGAGINAAVLGPSPGHVFFVNGSGPEISAEATSLNLPPYASTGAGPVPLGLVYSPTNKEGYLYVNIALGTKGTGIRSGLRSPYPLLFTPGGSEFMVCNVTQPVYGRPQYPVHVVGEDGEVPDHCARMHLLPQCATLPEPLLGQEEFGWQKVDASCYEDVKSLDWQKYSDPVSWRKQ